MKTVAREVLRPLGVMEYIYWLMDLGARSNFVFVAHVSGKIPLNVLQDAAERLAKSSPLLSAAILPDPSCGAVFVKSEEELVFTEAAAEPDNFLSLVEDEQHRSLDTEKGPLLRLKSVDCDGGQRLLFTFHHSIADGVSGARMVISFLEAADSLMSGSAPAISRIPDSGPCEALFPPRHRGAGAFLRALGWMNRISFDKNILRRYPPLPVDQAVPPQLRRERYIRKTLESQNARALIEKAKNEGAGLHSAICAAQAIALSGEYPAGKPCGMGLLSLVDLRKRLDPPVPDKVMNVFISTVESRCEVSPETGLWPLARQVEADIKQGISRGHHFEYFPRLAGMVKSSPLITPNNHKGSLKLLKNGQFTRPHVSVVSNIGRIPAGDFSSFAVSDIYFCVAFAGTALFGSAVNSWNMRLHITFGYAEPCISATRAENIAQRTMKILMEE